jgi:hypothetical protein
VVTNFQHMPCAFFPTGTLETAIHFVIYEHMKKVLSSNRQRDLELTECMFAAAAAKMTASSLCYPHGELFEELVAPSPLIVFPCNCLLSWADIFESRFRPWWCGMYCLKIFPFFPSLSLPLPFLVPPFPCPFQLLVLAM